MCNQMILSIKLSEIRYVIIENFYGREKIGFNVESDVVTCRYLSRINCPQGYGTLKYNLR